jgi:hypothetical protein
MRGNEVGGRGDVGLCEQFKCELSVGRSQLTESSYVDIQFWWSLAEISAKMVGA